MYFVFNDFLKIVYIKFLEYLKVKSQKYKKHEKQKNKHEKQKNIFALLDNFRGKKGQMSFVADHGLKK